MSDLALHAVASPDQVRRLQTLKGWAFVLVTGFGLFWLTRRELERARRSESEIARKARRLSDLHAIDRAILAAETLPEICSASLGRIRELIPCERASLTLFDLDREKATVVAVMEDAEYGPPAGAVLPLGDAFPEDRLAAGKILHVRDLDRFEGRWPLIDALHDAGIASVIASPLISKGRAVGLLTVSSARPRAFDREHLAIAREVSYQLAVACQQARMRDELMEQAERLNEQIDDLRRVDRTRRELHATLVHAQEAERDRIAADIHDDPIQKMTAVGMQLHALEKRLSEPDAPERIRRLQQTVSQAVARLRSLMFDLRPPELDRSDPRSDTTWRAPRPRTGAG